MGGLLATWDDVERAVSTAHRIAERKPEWLGLVWTFPVEGDDPMPQTLELALRRLDGRLAVRVLAHVAPRSFIDAAHGLERNFELTTGALAARGGWVFLVHHVFLPAPADELARVVEAIPYEAARIRRAYDLDLRATASIHTPFCE